ncbi:MAG: hypothetical protein NTY09_06485 [bacterium]|nr:hypothetical protein [bacterium]
MAKKLIQILVIILSFAISGCAWENISKEGEEPEPQRVIQVRMQVGGAKREDIFYYIVFNLSGDPAKKPLAIFDGVDRGKNWTVYYMWGKPPNHNLGLYRGYGGEGTGGSNLIDQPPVEQAFLNELMEGTSISGDQITLRIDLTKIAIGNGIFNLNMIVCNQAIDSESQFEYEFDPLVADSFYSGGISIDFFGIADTWNETNNPQEDIANEREELAPPEADIIDWSFRIISR